MQRVAVVGTGVIGSSWAAYFLARGLDVVATDPSPSAEKTLHDFVDRAWPELAKAGLSKGASKERLTFSGELEKALEGAGWVQENGPERVQFKQELFAEMDRLTPPEVILATSSSGLAMSEIQIACRHPERCVTGHPFNPPHIIPVVEVAGGLRTSEATIERAIDFYRQIGRRPVRLLKEVKGHAANRLQAALWRECVSLVASGVISVADIDSLVCWGVGLRWAVMGPNLLFHLGGGQGGMRHFLDHLGPAMSSWWDDLGQPQLTPDIRAALIAGVEEEADGQSVAELEVTRDHLLAGLLEVKSRSGQDDL